MFVYVGITEVFHLFPNLQNGGDNTCSDHLTGEQQELNKGHMGEAVGTHRAVQTRGAAN